jgi:hypothetical protein
MGLAVTQRVLCIRFARSAATATAAPKRGGEHDQRSEDDASIVLILTPQQRHATEVTHRLSRDASEYVGNHHVNGKSSHTRTHKHTRSSHTRNNTLRLAQTRTSWGGGEASGSARTVEFEKCRSLMGLAHHAGSYLHRGGRSMLHTHTHSLSLSQTQTHTHTPPHSHTGGQGSWWRSRGCASDLLSFDMCASMGFG